MTPLLTLAAMNPLDHVVNHPFLFYRDGSGTLWWIWSAHIGNLFLTMLIMVLGIPVLARRIATGPESQGNARYLPAGVVAHLFEVICVYLRDQVVRPLLHERTERFMPFLWTLFFFILINNLLGLIPILDILLLLFKFVAPGLAAEHRVPFGGTATGNIYINAALASIALVLYLVAGFRNLGVKGFLEHMTGGAPMMVWPIIIPIELASTFLIKPAALTIRLFANMTAGHVLLATMFMFVGMSFWALTVGWVPISIASVGAAFAFYFLELLVAFLQAFIFMFLTTIFIAQLSHHGPEHGHGHPEVPFDDHGHRAVQTAH